MFELNNSVWYFYTERVKESDVDGNFKYYVLTTPAFLS